MNRGLVLGVLVAVGAASAVTAAYQAQQQNQPMVVEVEKLKDNLFMLLSLPFRLFAGFLLLSSPPEPHGGEPTSVNLLSITGCIPPL